MIAKKVKIFFLFFFYSFLSKCNRTTKDFSQKIFLGGGGGVNENASEVKEGNTKNFTAIKWRISRIKSNVNQNSLVVHLRLPIFKNYLISHTMCALKRVRSRCLWHHILSIYLSLSICKQPADPNPFRGTHCSKNDETMKYYFFLSFLNKTNKKNRLRIHIRWWVLYISCLSLLLIKMLFWPWLPFSVFMSKSIYLVLFYLPTYIYIYKDAPPPKKKKKRSKRKERVTEGWRGKDAKKNSISPPPA